MPHYGRQSTEMRGLLHNTSSRSGAGDRTWRRAGRRLYFQHDEHAGDERLCIDSEVPSFFLRSPWSRESDALVLLTYALIPVFLFIMGWAIHFVARRVMLVDLVPPVWIDDKGKLSPLPPGQFLLVADKEWDVIDESRFVVIDAVRDLASDTFNTTIALMGGAAAGIPVIFRLWGFFNPARTSSPMAASSSEPDTQ